VHDIECEFPLGFDGAVVIERLTRVLDPELDESILDLGFVRSLRLEAGHASVALQLPTAWCAVNFAYLMAEDVRQALLSVAGIRRVTVTLGDHCAAADIEAAVNSGRSFAEAFSGEGAGDLAALRRNFLRKGFLGRQQRLLQSLREAGYSAAAICGLRLGDLSAGGETVELLHRYRERRTELGLDCADSAPLIVAPDGAALSAAQLEAHYEMARTIRVAMEANGSFCRALLDLHRGAAPEAHNHANTGGRDVPA